MGCTVYNFRLERHFRKFKFKNKKRFFAAINFAAGFIAFFFL